MPRVAHAYVEVLPTRCPSGDLRIVGIRLESKLEKLPRLLELVPLHTEHERKGSAQESSRPVTVAPLQIAFDDRNDRADAADDMPCNELAYLVHAAVGQIETLAPDRLRVAAKIEQTGVDLGILAVFRQGQIDEIVEVHAAKFMLADDASGDRGIRRHGANHVETAEAPERGGDFLPQRKGQILASFRFAGGKRQHSDAQPTRAATRCGRTPAQCCDLRFVADGGKPGWGAL